MTDPAEDAETPETPDLSETPIWDDLVNEHGELTPVLEALADALDTTPPEIDEAHGVVDVADPGPVDDPGPGGDAGGADESAKGDADA